MTEGMARAVSAPSSSLAPLHPHWQPPGHQPKAANTIMGAKVTLKTLLYLPKSNQSGPASSSHFRSRAVGCARAHPCGVSSELQWRWSGWWDRTSDLRPFSLRCFVLHHLCRLHVGCLLCQSQGPPCSFGLSRAGTGRAGAGQQCLLCG